MKPQTIPVLRRDPGSLADLLARYEGVLLDAWGVLIDSQGERTGAAALLSWLTSQDKPFVVVSNTAAALPEELSERLYRLGCTVDPERVLTSGRALADFFSDHDLVGRRCRVLGQHSSCVYVQQAGGCVVEPGEAFEVLVVADEEGYPFAPTLGEVLTTVIHRLDANKPVTLVVPNPDHLYPRAGGAVGIASGSIAALIEAALTSRYGEQAPRCHRVGKPSPTLFDAGCSLLKSRRVIAVGDQMETDVRGATAAGLDTILVLGGIGLAPPPDAALTPTFAVTHIDPLQRQDILVYP